MTRFRVSNSLWRTGIWCQASLDCVAPHSLTQVFNCEVKQWITWSDIFDDYFPPTAIVISEETLINGAHQLESVPLIVGLQTNYMLGQYLDVNCSLPQVINERMGPQLHWLIHNEKVSQDLMSLHTTRLISRICMKVHNTCIISICLLLFYSLKAKCKVRSSVFH